MLLTLLTAYDANFSGQFSKLFKKMTACLYLTSINDIPLITGGREKWLNMLIHRFPGTKYP